MRVIKAGSTYAVDNNLVIDGLGEIGEEWEAANSSVYTIETMRRKQRTWPGRYVSMLTKRGYYYVLRILSSGVGGGDGIFNG